MTPTRPVWAEISRSALTHNFRLLQRLAGPSVELLAVVKANAYGHGLADCADTLASAGAQWFGITCVEEGVALRAVCPKARILVLSSVWHGEAETLLEHRLTPVAWEPPHLIQLEIAARTRGLSAGTVPIHLEIDTGMSRQGAQPQHLAPVLDSLGPGSPFIFEALMTHFHSPENEPLTQCQTSAFAEALAVSSGRGLHPRYLNAGSSAAFFHLANDPIADLAKSSGTHRMLRPGIALYGYAPNPETVSGLQPVLSWKTRVVSLREIAPGTTVGYDATFTAQRKTRLALLSLGYADGLSRSLSSRGSVLIRGQRAPIAGRISMDHTSVDVTDIAGVECGDEVVIIGQQNGQSITAADIAQQIGTIPYEVLCGISARVPRSMVE